jgi:hypothetical protein
MKYSGKIIRLCCVGIPLLMSSIVTSAEVIDKIVAILDNELILLSEIREQVERPVVAVFANIQPLVDPEEEALAYIVEQRLLRREIQYLAFPKEKEFGESLAIDYIVTAYKHGSVEEFKRQLQAQGVTEADLEKELTLYMKGIDYIRRKYRFNTDINDPDVVLNLFRQWLNDLHAKATLQKLSS